MKFFIRFFILLLIISAAVYGYAWYKNKQFVDQYIAQSNGTYKSTYIDINGDSVTTGVSVPVAFFDTNYTIDEVRVGAGNPISFYKVINAFNSQDLSTLPENFKLYVHTTQEKLPISLKYNEVSKGLSSVALFQLPFAGCGQTSYLTSADYTDFGISDFASNSRMEFSFSQADKKAYLDIYSNMDKVQTLKVSLSLGNFNPGNPMGLQLSKGSIEISDNGIMRDINNLCAKSNDLTELQFTERHLSYLKHMLFQQGVYLSPEFYEQYAKYHSNPRSLKISFHPDNNLNPVALMGATPRQLFNLLNSEVVINDNSIVPLFGNKPDPSELPQLDAVTEEKSTLRTVQGLTIQPTAVSSIGRYVGYDVYFRYRGQNYKGLIQSVSGNNATIKYELNAGNHVAKQFLLSDISSLRVRREFVPPVEPDTE